MKVWFGCTNAIAAPNQDLNFVKDSIAYAKTDSAISAALLNKVKNHLWYLSEDKIALAFFDPNVNYEEKRKMVDRLQSKEPMVKLENNRSMKSLDGFSNYSLSDFVSQRTKIFFTRFGLECSFLDCDPSTWETNYEFEEAWTFCSDLLVVNDTAERGVKFMKDFNKVLTKDEDQNQLLLQIVEAYRKQYPSFAKSCLV